MNKVQGKQLNTFYIGKEPLDLANSCAEYEVTTRPDRRPKRDRRSRPGRVGWTCHGLCARGDTDTGVVSRRSRPGRVRSTYRCTRAYLGRRHGHGLVFTKRNESCGVDKINHCGINGVLRVSFTGKETVEKTRGREEGPGSRDVVTLVDRRGPWRVTRGRNRPPR